MAMNRRPRASWTHLRVKTEAGATPTLAERVAPAPHGSELERIELCCFRTISEMRDGGAHPVELVRRVHDDGWSDLVFAESGEGRLCVSFDRSGAARAAFVTEAARHRGPRVDAPAVRSDFQALRNVLLRTAREALRRGVWEFEVQHTSTCGVIGLRVRDGDGGEVNFAFDGPGAMWAAWSAPGSDDWFKRRWSELRREGRI